MQVRHIAALGAAAAIATTGAVALPGIAASAATTGKVTFLLVQEGNGSKNSGTAIVNGVITGGGKDVSKNNSDFDTLHLSGGTLRVTHPDKDSKFTFKPNPKTCYYAITGTGTYSLGHGTGRYKGVSGSGTFTFKGSGIAPKKKGACNFNSDGGPFAGYITGSGPATLP